MSFNPKLVRIGLVLVMIEIVTAQMIPNALNLNYHWLPLLSFAGCAGLWMFAFSCGDLKTKADAPLKIALCFFALSSAVFVALGFDRFADPLAIGNHVTAALMFYFFCKRQGSLRLANGWLVMLGYFLIFVVGVTSFYEFWEAGDREADIVYLVLNIPFFLVSLVMLQLTRRAAVRAVS